MIALTIAILTLNPKINHTEEQSASEIATPTIYKKEEKIQSQTLAVKILPEATSVPTPSVRSVITDGEILDYLQSKFLSHTAEALAVISCEDSSVNPRTISKTGDICFFQINLSAHWSEIPGEIREEKIEWLQNPLNCIDFARILFNRNQWGDWYKSEWCWRPKFNNL